MTRGCAPCLQLLLKMYLSAQVSVFYKIDMYLYVEHFKYIVLVICLKITTCFGVNKKERE